MDFPIKNLQSYFLKVQLKKTEMELPHYVSARGEKNFRQRGRGFYNYWKPW